MSRYSGKTWILIVLLLFVAIPLPAYYAIRDASLSPRASTIRTSTADGPAPESQVISYDLGVLSPNDQVHRTVTLRNRTAVKISVKGASNDCSCIVQKVVPPVIPPGSEYQVQFGYKTGMSPGLISRRMDVWFNEPQGQPVTIVLNGIIRSWAESNPRDLVFDKAVVGSASTAKLSVSYSKPHDWATNELKVTLAGLTVTHLSSLDAHLPIDNGKGTFDRFEVTYVPPSGIECGTQTGDIVITNKAAAKTLKIPVRATILGGLTADPPQVFLGFIKRGEAVSFDARIALNVPHVHVNLKDFMISHDDSEWLTVGLRESPRADGVLLVGRFKGGSKVGTHRARVAVKHPVAGQLILPVYGYVR